MQARRSFAKIVVFMPHVNAMKTGIHNRFLADNECLFGLSFRCSDLKMRIVFGVSKSDGFHADTGDRKIRSAKLASQLQSFHPGLQI